MKNTLERIAVLVSVGRHPVSGTPRYSRNDAAALEIGRRLAEAHGAQFEVLHAGDPHDPVLDDYLALGAPGVEVLACAAGSDAVPALAARLAGYDLVLTGTCAEGGFDSGMLPYTLAHALGYPLVGAAVELNCEGGRARVRQFLPKGVRRGVEVQLPALVAVHPLAAAVPRYAYARIGAGRIASRPGNAAPSAEAAQWTLSAATRRPVRLAAAERRSGHARMLSATTTESRGGSVVNEGSSVEKAQAVLDYLREHQLIDY
jgi:electron transfer flavoprotein beta subunit